MSYRFLLSLRVQRYFPDGKRFPQLHELANSDDIPASRWLAHEVDAQARGDRQRDDADLAEDGDVKRHICDACENWA